MVRAGVFDDVDIAICWHPAAFAGVNNPVSLACNETQLPLHRPRRRMRPPRRILGRSALDAVELMNVGVNYLREHMPSTARIHYAMTDTGGVGAECRAGPVRRCAICMRARNLPELLSLVERVKKVAEGAALMTETTVRQRGDQRRRQSRRQRPARSSSMHGELERLGPPAFDDADRDTARQFQADHAAAEDIAASYARFGLKPEEGPAALRRDLPALCAATARIRRLHRCRQGQLGGPDGADARRDLCHRHARPFLAAGRAGQAAGRAQGHGPMPPKVMA